MFLTAAGLLVPDAEDKHADDQDEGTWVPKLVALPGTLEAGTESGSASTPADPAQGKPSGKLWLTTQLLSKDEERHNDTTMLTVPCVERRVSFK